MKNTLVESPRIRRRDRPTPWQQKYAKRYRNLEPREQMHKIGAALARRGFDWETIKGGCKKA